MSSSASDLLLSPLDKANLRIENEKYIRSHPELDEIINNFLISCLKEKPKDIIEYSVKYFVKNQVGNTSNDSNNQQKGEKSDH